MVYELDDLSFKVLANSNCQDLDSLAMLKLIKELAPIEN